MRVIRHILSIEGSSWSYQTPILKESSTLVISAMRVPGYNLFSQKLCKLIRILHKKNQQYWASGSWDIGIVLILWSDRYSVPRPSPTPKLTVLWEPAGTEAERDGGGAKTTQSKNTCAIGDDAKPWMLEIFFGKRARRRETRRRLKNAHRRETRKLFRDARPALQNCIVFTTGTNCDCS